MAKKIGVYPGTFDPVHQGHIAFAAETKKQCGLDEILFLPEMFPRGKPKVSPLHTRIPPLIDAIKKLDNASVIQLDDERFTVAKTLPTLQQLYGTAELTLLIGSDVAQTFKYRWENLDVLLHSVSFAIGMRTGDSDKEMVAIMTYLQNYYNLTASYTLIHTEYGCLSSSQFRNQS